MGYQASRPIVVEVVDAGVVYVPLARDREYITIQVTGGGLTTLAVDYTLDNITRGPASSYDANLDPSHVTPASATWDVFEADLVATPMTVGKELQALGLRLTGSGTGTARVVIAQS